MPGVIFLFISLLAAGMPPMLATRVGSPLFHLRVPKRRVAGASIFIYWASLNPGHLPPRSSPDRQTDHQCLLCMCMRALCLPYLLLVIQCCSPLLWRRPKPMHVSCLLFPTIPYSCALTSLACNLHHPTLDLLTKRASISSRSLSPQVL